MRRPQPYYSGPIRGITPSYGGPYEVELYCPKCGSLHVKEGETYFRDGSMPGDYKTMVRYECEDCGKKFRLPRYSLYNDETLVDPKKARFKVTERDDDPKDKYFKAIPRDEVEGAMRDLAKDDDPTYHETAYDYYGSYLDFGDDEEHSDDEDPDFEWRGNLEGDIPFVTANHAMKKGYIDSLKVGESYNMPGFDVKVTRTKNLKGGVYAERRRKAAFWRQKR